MSHLRYTLVGDGTSDRALIPIIDWVIGSIPEVAEAGFVSQFADPHIVGSSGKGLIGKVQLTADRYPADVIFVHRDAEREPPERRLEEIGAAATGAGVGRCVPIVPVRMTEAWLLCDEAAIRRAADNPNGEVALRLPRLAHVEALPDPKELLSELLLEASEKRGRRLDQFRGTIASRRVRVAQLIADYSPLRSLPAFRVFEAAARGVIRRWLLKH